MLQGATTVGIANRNKSKADKNIEAIQNEGDDRLC